METRKKLLQYHVFRLKDRNPGVQLEAIRELAELGDPEALDPLRVVFQSDAPVEVRKAAQAAAVKIVEKNKP
ncbi:MAG: HEAT repeat domain-containing protein [Pleurocapsa minor GSE-CHR-MK-17-07R]|jgi:HEAT repeat protein|nr:HEAT repeat domain-containing protein [Pleurocapsa minor GSE-CHR-MK 17-07R]